MNQYTDPPAESFETLLLKAHPETALIHELASRLRTLPLPIADWDDLVGKLQREPIPELLQVPTPNTPCLPDELFPIRDEADLAVKLTATIRTFLRQAQAGAGSPARLALPLHKRLATLADEAATGTSRGSGVFDDGGLLGAEQALTKETRSVWVVTLVLHDCDTGQLLPWSWLTDWSVTYLFDANAQFIAVIDGMWTSYAVLVMREGYINRRFVLDSATMAGTTQHICLNRA
ncbi:hypothetical protein ABZ128_09915 [Streptomyces sp. NPDC006326]|uniref:hypothetical protein n=1 Tax=Streptomyces sp. NPDC006326 TaxID=3156752 RepID=UPI0033BDCE6C